MRPEDEPKSTQRGPVLPDEVVAFLKGRSAPCPRCAYDLRDIQTAICPECAEPLWLTIGSAQPRFGWLVLAMVPGCFSGVAAVFVLVPIVMSVGRNLPPGQGAPWPVLIADAFGFLSAASVWMMYRQRRRFLALRTGRQRALAGAVWGAHFLALALLVLAVWYWN